jgi:hypothetical protein
MTICYFLLSFLLGEAPERENVITIHYYIIFPEGKWSLRSLEFVCLLWELLYFCLNSIIWFMKPLKMRFNLSFWWNNFFYIFLCFYCLILQSEQWRTYSLSTPNPSFNSRQAIFHHQQHKKLSSSSQQPTTPSFFTVVNNNSHHIYNSRTNFTFKQTRFG